MWAVLSSLLSETCSAHSTEQFHVSTLSETGLPDPFWANGEQLVPLRTILLAQELVPQDCSSHAAENQRPNLPRGADLTLSPQFIPPLSVSQRLQIMILSLLQVSEHSSPSPLAIRVFHVLLSRCLIFLPFVEHGKPCCSCSVWV